MAMLTAPSPVGGSRRLLATNVVLTVLCGLMLGPLAYTGTATFQQQARIDELTRQRTSLLNRLNTPAVTGSAGAAAQQVGALGSRQLSSSQASPSAQDLPWGEEAGLAEGAYPEGSAESYAFADLFPSYAGTGLSVAGGFQATALQSYPLPVTVAPACVATYLTIFSANPNYAAAFHCIDPTVRTTPTVDAFRLESLSMTRFDSLQHVATVERPDVTLSYFAGSAGGQTVALTVYSRNNLVVGLD